MFEDLLGGAVRLANGDSRDVLKTLPDNSVDSVVCDPPYALVSIVKRFGSPNAAPATGNEAYARASAGFMGKTWDTGETAFAVEFWAEVMRVLKPGGHVIAFSGTRTYHRLAVAIEDAGFELRDMLSWLYGSGFPKSHDVAKGIDKAAGVEGGRGAMKRGGERLLRETTNGARDGGGTWGDEVGRSAFTYVPGSPEAAQWQGWGTALKPACEPIVLARKPLAGTVAANVLAHGTGALNIDGCRVGHSEECKAMAAQECGNKVFGQSGRRAATTELKPQGRWPANVLHDGSEEVVTGFPVTTPSPGGTVTQGGGAFGSGAPRGGKEFQGHGDSGSAARFFYSAKADAMDRIGSKHPTVKPVDLMQWLCRLVTPPGGVVLDPFAGSGTTGEAAFREGFRAILVEREADYCEDIRERMRLAMVGPKTKRRAIAKRKDKGEELGGLFA